MEINVNLRLFLKAKFFIKYYIFFIFVLCTQVGAFPLDGAPVQLVKRDLIGLNENTCLGYSGVDKYVAWKFPSPASYISARVYCNTTTAADGYQRRNVFDCDNKKGEWGCDIIATELKFLSPSPVEFIYLSSSYLSDIESLDVINNLIAITTNPSVYRKASCSVEYKNSSSKNLYLINCDHKNYVEILKTCSGDSCSWKSVKNGSVFK